MYFRRVSLPILIATALLMSTAGSIAQKGKPAPPRADIRGESLVRCSDSPYDVLCGDAGIDGSLYVDAVNGVQSEITALSGGAEQFRLRLRADSDTDRHFTIRFPGAPLVSADFECMNDATYGCFAEIPVGGIVLASPIQDVEHAGMATAGAPGLLTGLAEGGMTETTFVIGFPDPDRNTGYRWALYWNPSLYPGTDLAAVTRTGACEWTIAADENAVAGLILFNVPKTKKGGNKTLESYEGRFQMPFEVRFTANAGSLAGC
jgi:hypothetical protein